MKQPAQTTTSAAQLTTRIPRHAKGLPQRIAKSLCVGGLAGGLALSAVHAQTIDKAQARAEQPHAPAPVKPASPAATAAAATTTPKAKSKQANPAKKAQAKQGAARPAKPAAADRAPTLPPSAASAKPVAQPAGAPVAATPAAPVVQPKAADPAPACRLADNEQPRGGRLDVVGDRFGTAPVVRIAGKPARMLIRKQDRISVQVPADSNGGEITLLNDGKVFPCGTLVIIGKDR